ncbi:MAG: hypothetical protein D6719_07880 [Candidatus Dadabacteria bacterium]|nr:MAG: hypothetical protein D6719_07880 [Candidatus Dadabacteria bacterium]
MPKSYCFKCRAELKQPARYCPSCGANLSKLRSSGKLGLKGYLALLLFTVFLWGSFWWLQPKLIGTPPKNTATGPGGSRARGELADRLDALREKVAAKPSDLKSWQALASALLESLAVHRGEPERAQLEELKAALQKILELSPEDKGALLSMAELSFTLQDFGSAEKYYRRFLKIEPDNLKIRARHASTLAFLGNHDGAINELREVLNRDPENFAATSYLAIVYSQKGDLKHAQELGKKALSLAPSREAADRLSAFLKSISGPESSGDSAESDYNTRLEKLIRNQPVAGKRFDSLEVNSTEITLYFKAFPMDQMPAGPRQKFLSRLKFNISSLKESSGKHVRLVDKDSGREMAAFDIP